MSEPVEILVSSRARRWRLTAPRRVPARLLVPRGMGREEAAHLIAS